MMTQAAVMTRCDMPVGRCGALWSFSLPDPGPESGNA